MSSTLDFARISNKLGAVSQKHEEGLETQIAKGDTSTKGLLQMQQTMQQWSTAVSLESQMIKTLGDLLKSIVQKMG